MVLSEMEGSRSQVTNVALWLNIDNRRGYAYMGIGIQYILVRFLYSQFGCEPEKTRSEKKTTRELGLLFKGRMLDVLDTNSISW